MKTTKTPLGITAEPSTIDSHREPLKQELNLPSGAELIRHAIETAWNLGR